MKNKIEVGDLIISHTIIGDDFLLVIAVRDKHFDVLYKDGISHNLLIYSMLQSIRHGNATLVSTFKNNDDAKI